MFEIIQYNIVMSEPQSLNKNCDLSLLYVI